MRWRNVQCPQGNARRCRSKKAVLLIMVTITIAHPNRHAQGMWQVFGTRESGEDHFVFAVKEFNPERQDLAEEYARELLEKHQADHLARLV